MGKSLIPEGHMKDYNQKGKNMSVNKWPLESSIENQLKKKSHESICHQCTVQERERALSYNIEDIFKVQIHAQTSMCSSFYMYQPLCKKCMYNCTQVTI